MSYSVILLIQYIVTALTELGWKVAQDRFQSETPLGLKTFTNIGMLLGKCCSILHVIAWYVVATIDESATSFLVLAAHYDSKILPKFVCIECVISN